jgi:DivIVA domain-containing protein
LSAPPPGPDGTRRVITADQIRNHDLPETRWRRGYDIDAVHQLLDQAAERLAAAEEEVQRLTRTLQVREWEIEQRRYGIRLPTNSRAELIRDDQVNWQLRAQAYSDDLTATAQAQAEQIVGEAQIQARHIQAQSAAQDAHGATTYRSGHDELTHLRSLLASMSTWMHDLRQHIDHADDSIGAELARWDDTDDHPTGSVT